jgi:Flp pilus assembly protein TadG
MQQNASEMGAADLPRAANGLKRLGARFVGNRRGNVAIIFAMSMPLVVGGLGFGVETGYWYYQQLRLQQAADAAAYAAGLELRGGKSYQVVLATASAAAQQNGYDPAGSGASLQVHTPPTSGGFQNASSVEVELARNEQRFFSQLISSGPVTTTARSVSTFTNASNACVLALDPIASRAANFSGNGTTTLSGCSVMANSLAADAVNVQGSSLLTTTCVMAGGGVSANGGLTMTGCTSPMTNLPPVADPFASLVEPLDTGNCRNSNGATLQPGRYCNGLNLNGNVNLNPGTYIISGGTFRINANAVITGTGVTIYLANDASTQFNGNATINLSAPTSGSLSGILFFGSRTNTSGNTLNGTASSHLTGNIYTPGQPVDYLGNFSGLNGCTHIVGKTVQWTGNTTVGVNCTAYGMADVPVPSAIKLVE